jgi:inward rectifier potassium channel
VNEQKNKELGFGKNVDKDFRFIKRDGSINVKRKGLPLVRPYDLFHTLITMGWLKFLFLVGSSFFLINAFFAFVYCFLGEKSVSLVSLESEFEAYWDYFFFSVQTITTLGYGAMSPLIVSAKIISSLESFIGLLGIALVTGLLYGRFSRPVAKIKYSNFGVVAPFQEGTAFMVKLANQRSSKLIESEVRMLLSYSNENGRMNLPMDLELKKIDFLALTWTVVHPINEESPWFNLTEEDLRKGNAEIIVLLKAFDDTFSQTVYSRMSYKHNEIIWGAKFKSSITTENNQTTIDLARIDEIEILS